MDLVIEKATELGVDNVRPYTAKRSVRLSVSPARHDRWRRIAENAAKQSQQVHVPELYDVCAYEDVLATTTEATRLILVEPELLPHALPLDILMAANRASTIVLVGPEGGLSAADLSLAVHYDFRPTSLGGSTLRAETAAIAAVAILSFLRNRNSPIACDERHADLQV